jgi:hypothetical protein
MTDRKTLSCTICGAEIPEQEAVLWLGGDRPQTLCRSCANKFEAGEE